MTGQLAAILILLSAAGLASQEPSVLADAPGVEIVRARCLACHGGDLIAGQRLSAAGWGREIDKMVRWGARVPDADREALQAYLAGQFAPMTVASHDPNTPGAATFTRACRACHGPELVASQRLSLAGWTREVEKMIRWGARVADADKASLVSYLAAAYPAP